MNIKMESTKDVVSDGVKVLVYGDAGTGKTVLCSTAPSPIILSAESGLLSLRGFDIPVITIKSFQDLIDAHTWISSDKDAQKFKTICLDSISEIAEVVLSDLKNKNKDARQAYGQMQESIMKIVKNFRNLKGKNVYFTAKEDYVRDEFDGSVSYMPGFPGKNLGKDVPYLFDEVFQLYVHAQQLEEGGVKHVRYLRTSKDVQHKGVKDRSGTLSEWENPNLTEIFNKISVIA
jgi:phage nucleotide-binding protein